MAWASPRNPGPLQRAGSGRLGPRASGGVLPAAHPASAAQTFPAGDAWPPQERGTKLALRRPAAPRREGEGREGSDGRPHAARQGQGKAGGRAAPASAQWGSTQHSPHRSQRSFLCSPGAGCVRGGNRAGNPRVYRKGKEQRKEPLEQSPGGPAATSGPEEEKRQAGPSPRSPRSRPRPLPGPR